MSVDCLIVVLAVHLGWSFARILQHGLREPQGKVHAGPGGLLNGLVPSFLSLLRLLPGALPPNAPLDWSSGSAAKTFAVATELFQRLGPHPPRHVGVGVGAVRIQPRSGVSKHPVLLAQVWLEHPVHARQEGFAAERLVV